MTSAALKYSLEEVSVGRVRYKRAPGGRFGGQCLAPSMELLVAVTLRHRIAYRYTPYLRDLLSLVLLRFHDRILDLWGPRPLH